MKEGSRMCEGVRSLYGRILLSKENGLYFKGKKHHTSIGKNYSLLTRYKIRNRNRIRNKYYKMVFLQAKTIRIEETFFTSFESK